MVITAVIDDEFYQLLSSDHGFPMIIQEHSLILFYKSPSLQHNHTDTDPTVVAYSAYHITREVDTSNVSGNK